MKVRALRRAGATVRGHALPVLTAIGLGGAVIAAYGFGRPDISHAVLMVTLLVCRLVREAQTNKAPLSRLADRYAVVFMPVTRAAHLRMRPPRTLEEREGTSSCAVS